MGPLEFLNHLLNFAMPAATVALVLALAGPFVSRPAAGSSLRWWKLALVLFAVGLMVLVAGLVITGRDGAIRTYAALVVACATAQWLAQRAWRR